MTRTRMFSLLLMGVAVAIGCSGGRPQDAQANPEAKPADSAAASQAASTSNATGGSKVQGSIKFEGTAPGAEKIKMNADPVCQQQHSEPVASEDVVVNPNGTLKNVFVYVKEGASGDYPAPTTPVVLDQHGCWYTPHVFGLQVGQPLQILNSDSTLHNVNAKTKVNKPFNLAQPVKDMKTDKKFEKPEVMVAFKCNVHPWMHAYGGVLNHPFYAVSDENGNFEIKGLPAGTYTIEAWHEKYGTQTQSVTIAAGENKTADFTFKAQ